MRYWFTLALGALLGAAVVATAASPGRSSDVLTSDLAGTPFTDQPSTIIAKLHFSAADERLARSMAFHNVEGWKVIETRWCPFRNTAVLVVTAEAQPAALPAPDTSYWAEPCFLAGPWGDSLDAERLARFRAAWHTRIERATRKGGAL